MPGLNLGVENIVEGVQYLTVTSTTHASIPPSTTSSLLPKPPLTFGMISFKGPMRPPAIPAQSPTRGASSYTAQATNTVIVASSSPRSIGNPAAGIASIIHSTGSNTDVPVQTQSNPASAIIPVIVGGTSSHASNLPPSQKNAPASIARSTASVAQLAPHPSKSAPSIVLGSTVVPVSTFASTTIVAGSSTTIPAFKIGPSTVALGQTVTLSNTPVAFITSADRTHAVIGGTSTSALYAPVHSAAPGEKQVSPANSVIPASSPSPITVGGQIFAPNSQSEYTAENGQTIAVGSFVTIGNGPSPTVIGLQTNTAGNTELVVGDSTSQLSIAANTLAVAEPILQAAGETATPNSQGQYVVAGQTLAPGSAIIVPGKPGRPATTIALQTNNAGQTAAVINGQTSALAANAAPSPLVIGSQTVQPNPAGQFVVSGSTLAPGTTATITGIAGAPPTTVGLQTNAAGQTEAVVNGQTSSLSPAPTALPLYVGGQTIYPNSQSQYIVSGHTLIPGATTIIPGSQGAPATTIGLSTDGAGHIEAVVNGKTSVLATPAVSSSVVPINIGGQKIYPNAQSQYVVSGETLMPGSTVTVPGSNGSPALTVALQTDGAGHTEAIVNGQTSTLSQASPVTSAPLIVGGQTVLPNPAGQYIISGKTLNPGSTITIPGINGSPSTTVALQTELSGGSAAVINGQTSTLTPSVPVTEAPLIVGGETLLPNSAGSYIISGQTLTPGAAITIPGDGSNAPSTTIALTTDAQGRTEAVVNGQTATLTPSPITGTPFVLSSGGETLLPNLAGGYIVNGQTLTFGHPITIPAASPGSPPTTLALTTNSGSATEAIINGRTELLSGLSSAATSGAPLVIGTQTITPNAAGAYVVDGSTLTLDGAVTLGAGASRTTVDLTTDGAGQTEVVVNGHTSLLSTASGASTTGVGAYIISGGLGGSGGGGGDAGASTTSASGVKRIAPWVIGVGLGCLSGVLAVIL
ncbi:MAG: hypothetical protein M1822_009494 [Bathelium mastoideum]|nr:MAG: hypothetical protein M1822_009494 [Bathelium mastoideum]